MKNKQIAKTERPSTSFKVERMVMTDLDQVLAIERKTFSPPWTKGMFLSELWDNPFSFSYVVKEEGLHEVIGYLCFWAPADELHLINIAIHPEWRRKGIGEELVRLALEAGQERAARIATLEVRASNAPAQALYRKFGFREVGCRRNYYPDPKEDALLLQYDFAPFSSCIKNEMNLIKEETDGGRKRDDPDFKREKPSLS